MRAGSSGPWKLRSQVGNGSIAAAASALRTRPSLNLAARARQRAARAAAVAPVLASKKQSLRAAGAASSQAGGSSGPVSAVGVAAAGTTTPAADGDPQEPAFFDTLFGPTLLTGRGFDGLNLQAENGFPVDAAVAANTTNLLNAVAGKAALYPLNAATGNVSGAPLATTFLSGLFKDVYVGTEAAAPAYERAYEWPSAIYDKIARRFVLACASSARGDTLDGTRTRRTYPAGGAGGVYLAVSPTSAPQTGVWQTWGLALEPCADANAYALPDMVQLTYDRYGYYIAVSTVCVDATTGAASPGKAGLFAFDKDVVLGLRVPRFVPYWDVSAGLGALGGTVRSLTPARPQGRAEADREIAFFVAQDAGAAPEAVLDVQVFALMFTGKLAGAAPDAAINPAMCQAKLSKNPQFQ